jgi:hypothetical protein
MVYIQSFDLIKVLELWSGMIKFLYLCQIHVKIVVYCELL